MSSYGGYLGFLCTSSDFEWSGMKTNTIDHLKSEHVWYLSSILEYCTRFRRVLGVVKDENVTGGCLGSDDAGVLGHASSSIHLALVVDLDLNLDLARDRAEAAELSLLVVVVRRVEL